MTLDAPAAGVVEPRRRLHPLSPLLHSAKLLAALIAALSFQGFAQLGFRGFLGTVVVGMCVVVAYSVLTWLVTGYHVVGRELRIYDGVVVRRSRTIPLERLQSVEVIRPLLARISGLAELRLEVVGGGKTEAPLAFLTAADAATLRQRLLALAAGFGAPAVAAEPTGAAPAEGAADTAGIGGAGTGAAGTGGTGVGGTGVGAAGVGGVTRPDGGAGTGPAAAGRSDDLPASGIEVAGGHAPARRERPLHTVVNRDVVISQLLTPQVMFLPVGVALVILQPWFGGGAWSWVVIASMATGVIGVIQQPVRRIVSDWNFQLALQEPPPGSSHHQLRVRQGLTETRSQTVPLNRVQAVGVTWPLLWKRRQWLWCRLAVAGYRPADRGGRPYDRLLPVGDLDTAGTLTSVVLPGVDLGILRLTGPPRRARALAPWRQPILGCALTDRVFATRDGRITRELLVVPYERIQSVRVVQGPLQRMLGLADVYADTAAPTAVAHHRDLAEARALAAELTWRAATARDAERAGTVATTTPPPTPPALP